MGKWVVFLLLKVFIRCLVAVLRGNDVSGRKRVFNSKINSKSAADGQEKTVDTNHFWGNITGQKISAVVKKKTPPPMSFSF